MGFLESRIMPADEYTYLRWKLDDAVASGGLYYQTGTFNPYGAGNLQLGATGSGAGEISEVVIPTSTTHKQIRYDTPGLITRDCVDIINNHSISSQNAYLRTNPFGSSGITGLSTYQFSVHGWYRPTALPGGSQFTRLFTQWADNTGVNPGAAPDSFAVMINGNSGKLYAQARYIDSFGDSYNTGTSANYYNARDPINLHKWNHIAVVFTYGDVYIYLNGNVVDYSSGQLGIQVNWTNNGVFSLGGSPVGYSGANGQMNDWRVDNIARSHAYFRDLYTRANPGY